MAGLGLEGAGGVSAFADTLHKLLMEQEKARLTAEATKQATAQQGVVNADRSRQLDISQGGLDLQRQIASQKDQETFSPMSQEVLGPDGKPQVGALGKFGTFKSIGPAAPKEFAGPKETWSQVPGTLNGKPAFAFKSSIKSGFVDPDTGEQLLNFKPTPPGSGSGSGALGLRLSDTPDGPVRVDMRTGQATPVTMQGTGDRVIKPLASQNVAASQWAKDIVPHINVVEQEAEKLNKAGLFGPLSGRFADVIANKIGSGEMAAFLAGVPADQRDEYAQLLGKFRGDMVYLQSAAAKAHNQRGATAEMMKHLEDIMNSHKDLQTFKGNLASSRDWLTGYANMTPDRPDLPQTHAAAMPPKDKRIAGQTTYTWPAGGPNAGKTGTWDGAAWVIK